MDNNTQWEYIDSFPTELARKLDKVIVLLKEVAPDVNWRTHWHDHEDIHGFPTSYITIDVPLENAEEAKVIYEDLKEEHYYLFNPSVFQDLIDEIIEFRNERDWKKFHNPKDLAISLSIEASELLENFQWKSSKEAVDNKFDNIKDELADIMIYSLIIAHELEINVEEAIQNKLNKNSLKYPKDKAFGSNKKYTELNND